MSNADQKLFFSVVNGILITKVFDKQLRIKTSDIKEWRFDGSMLSFSNSNKFCVFIR